MTTAYTPERSANTAPMQYAATRYTGAAALCAAIRAAAELAPEYRPEAEFPQRYRSMDHLYPLQPAEYETGDAVWTGPRTFTVVNGQTIGRDESVRIVSDGPACRFPRVDAHPEAPGPFLSVPSDARVTFAYRVDGQARGSLTVANTRAALLSLADKVHANRGAFDGKAKRAAKPAKTPAGSAPHVTARAMLESGDLAGALQMADAHGPAFFGHDRKGPGILYMRAEAFEFAGSEFVIGRQVAGGRFVILGAASGLSIGPRAPDRSDFATYSAARAWLDSMAADAPWVEKLAHAIQSAPAYSQADARARYEQAGASAAPTEYTATQAHEPEAVATVAPESVPDAPAGPDVDPVCTMIYADGICHAVTRARAAYLLRAGRSRAAGNVRRSAAHVYVIADAVAQLETGRNSGAPESPPLPVISAPDATVRHVDSAEFAATVLRARVRASAELYHRLKRTTGGAAWVLRAIKGDLTVIAPLQVALCKLASDKRRDIWTRDQARSEADALACDHADCLRETAHPVSGESDPVPVEPAARTVPAGRYATDTHERPCAAPGLTSYRARGAFGWIMIGATDAADALREARRSSDSVKPETLEVWDGTRYVPALNSDPVPSDSEPEAPSLDGLDVAELGPEALAEFTMPSGTPLRAAELKERARQSVAIPWLRIPAYDLRSRVPARFAPSYLLQA